MLAAISDIVCSDRIRAVNTAAVKALSASIQEVGLLNPVTVSSHTIVREGRARDGYLLISGMHRLEAAKALGWTEIEITVSDLSGPAAVIAECDENLCGTNLTASERALFTRRRKEAYEALHPETRHGGDRASCQLGDLKSDRFTADTATKTGQSERTIQRDASRGERVAPEVLSSIAGTKLDTGKTLDELASIPKEMQAVRVTEIAERRAVKPAPTPLNDIETEEQWMGAMMRVWNRGAREWRERFLSTVDAPVFDAGRAA